MKPRERSSEAEDSGPTVVYILEMDRVFVGKSRKLVGSLWKVVVFQSSNIKESKPGSLLLKIFWFEESFYLCRLVTLISSHDTLGFSTFEFIRDQKSGEKSEK